MAVLFILGYIKMCGLQYGVWGILGIEVPSLKNNALIVT